MPIPQQLSSVLSSPLWQRYFLEDSSGLNEGEKHTHRKQSQEEKCEPLALVTAQPDKLPKWKGLTVNSPLRGARSRGTQQPVSRLLSCSGTAAASICLFNFGPTWVKCVPPPLLWQRSLMKSNAYQCLFFFFFPGMMVLFRADARWIKYYKLHNV